MQNKAGNRHGGKTRGFLTALARDIRGNTLAIVAVALIPLTAMIGSGLDMSIAYMAQDRLQQACDAGVLAARKLLAGQVLTDPVKDEANKYFNFNFPQGSFQTADFTPKVTVPQLGTVRMTAETTIPTSIMKIFGYKRLKIDADCASTQDFISTDIMLVVDMSGSMNCAPGVGGSCGNREASNSKMGALRAAATSLYDTLETAQNQLHDNNLRLRYGFMPYNATVNVGKLVYAKNPSYIRKSNDYQTRKLNNYRSWVDEKNCQGNGLEFTPQFSWGGTTIGICANWTWKQDTLDTSAYAAGETVPTPTQLYGTSTWDGCIEMRETNNKDIDGGSATIAPADAYDLDIDMIPHDDATRWAPWWPEVEMNRNSSTQTTANSNCASEASRLKEYYNNKKAFTDYLDGLHPQGSTYHDIGMIWGARFLSQNGIFKSATPETNNQFDPDNPKKIRGFQVRKYLIFMTDGEMAPTMDGYSSYGIENYDKRVTRNKSNQKARHLQRFEMACNAAKSEGIEVWVIAFATSLTSEMKDCASTPDKAAGINNSDDLIKKFQEIGSKIGSLRLSE